MTQAVRGFRLTALNFIITLTPAHPAPALVTIKPIITQGDGAWVGLIGCDVIGAQQAAPPPHVHRLQAIDKGTSQKTHTGCGQRRRSHRFGNPQHMLEGFVLVPTGPVLDALEYLAKCLRHQLAKQ
ncbi:hypothetical protein D3C81_1900470 [compost metagenome]